MIIFQFYYVCFLVNNIAFYTTLFFNALSKLLFFVKLLMSFIFFIFYNFIVQNIVVLAIHFIYTRIISSGFCLANNIQYKRSYHGI